MAKIKVWQCQGLTACAETGSFYIIGRSEISAGTFEKLAL